MLVPPTMEDATSDHSLCWGIQLVCGNASTYRLSNLLSGILLQEKSKNTAFVVPKKVLRSKENDNPEKNDTIIVPLPPAGPLFHPQFRKSMHRNIVLSSVLKGLSLL